MPVMMAGGAGPMRLKIAQKSDVIRYASNRSGSVTTVHAIVLKGSKLQPEIASALPDVIRNTPHALLDSAPAMRVGTVGGVNLRTVQIIALDMGSA